jgi:hypothetical protein
VDGCARLRRIVAMFERCCLYADNTNNSQVPPSRRSAQPGVRRGLLAPRGVSGIDTAQRWLVVRLGVETIRDVDIRAAPVPAVTVAGGS